MGVCVHQGQLHALTEVRLFHDILWIWNSSQARFCNCCSPWVIVSFMVTRELNTCYLLCSGKTAESGLRTVHLLIAIVCLVSSEALTRKKKKSHRNVKFHWYYSKWEIWITVELPLNMVVSVTLYCIWILYSICVYVSQVNLGHFSWMVLLYSIHTTFLFGITSRLQLNLHPIERV